MRITRSVILGLLFSAAAFSAQDKDSGSGCGEALLWPGSRLRVVRDSENLATSRLVDAYLRYAAFAQSAGGLPSYLELKIFAYVLDALSPGEQSRLAVMLEYCLSRVNKDLAKAGDAEILQKLVGLDAQVRALKKDHKKAVSLAIENHDNRGQKYADHPYSFHLRNARAVLKRFGLGPRTSLLGLRLGTVTWLHDIIEDTPVTVEMLEALLGRETALDVVALTNEPKQEGLSKHDRKRITFERIGERRHSRIVKLADRITNVEESLRNSVFGRTTKIDKYRAEWPLFKQYLYRDHEAPEVLAMQEHLERLLTDSDYARAQIFAGTVRRPLKLR